MKVAAVLLAAGQGTRMKSNLPKVLHSLAGKPMLWHTLQALNQAATEKPVVIVGHEASQVMEFVGDAADCVLQEPQLGTGHAAMQAGPVLEGKSDYVIVTYADMPLLRGQVFQQLVETQKKNSGPISMLTVVAEDPRGFGRIVRNDDGTVAAIVEEYVATPEQKSIKELNVGAYCFSADWLWDALGRIQKNPHKGEYYLTDTIELAAREGLAVQALIHDDLLETIGINTRVHLAEAEDVLRRRINQELMLAGVTMIDPGSTYVEAGVTIGMDTLVMPNTYIQGSTTIGEGCEIGPNAHIRNSRIGNRCKVFMSVMESAQLEDDVDVGPFARLRKGAHLMDHVHMGNFGEVKDSTLGRGVKMGHFSYIGNATIGANTNIGAGTITCNFDGKNKHPTEIGEEVFIGSDSMLVAPLKIGDRSRTGAGAVVTKDVPEDTLVVGMPARAIRKLEKHDPD
jgi:bifunctional UDP-N-acetylglucosamine pyrophosphorylase/glucosamine-1-phosphate N-acetyltransferase